MTDMRIKEIVIAGGGTAGWMAAAAFAKVLGNECTIRLVESEEIGTVGVGEGTVPHLKLFNNLLGIDDVEFVRNTQGTFKLGVQFNDWARLGDSYVHGFGEIGHDISLLPFHQFWIKAMQKGVAADIGAYSLNTVAAPRGRFMPSATDVPPNSPLANVAYAYHFDAGLYARFLRGYAEQRGVWRTEGRIASVELRPHDGFVAALVMEDGERIEGDLFIDCSGFRGLLIEQALHTGFHDFSHWLPCDRAVAVGCERVAQLTPYTRSTARPAGWQWRIPLQHRTGNGHVYCSVHMSDDEAAAVLLANLDGEPLGEPRLLRFTTGARKQAWNRNVVALGLAGGFLEPLESTSIYMIQSGIARLLEMFPQRDFSPVLIERYNARARFEYERIRDFLILHYHATERDDTPFWNYCRTMPVPEQLDGYIRLFRDSGRFFRDGEEMFATPSWVQVMLGQRILPRSYHPLVDQMPEKDLAGFMASVSQVVKACVEAMPMHQAFIDKVCPAPAMATA
ncbi:tryptophan halogenase family protein [Rhodanobacter aciditrophus]|uniref:tryptophan halogenase family protein n=1 Tax=Rhodanobacter aciditrophus TaxID=1623218 RepID=UPI003CEDE72F